MQTSSLLNIVIYDDDRADAATLGRLVRSLTRWPVYLCTTNSVRVGQYIKAPHPPTLFYLDIVAGAQTPGLELARQIAAQPHSSDMVLFVTDYPEIVVLDKLAQTNCLAFLSKDSKILAPEISLTFEAACRRARLRVVVTPSYGCKQYIPLESIAYVSTIKRQKRLCVHCTNGKEHETTGALYRFLQKYSPPLVQVSRTHAVYTPNITQQNTATLTLHFKAGGGSCPYSPTYYSGAPAWGHSV